MKKTLSLLLVSTLIMVLAGCGKSSEDSNTLRIGIDDSYPPMEFVNDAGEIDGFDIDFVNALKDELGVEIEWVPTAWDGIFTGLTSGNYDMIVSSVSITEERLESYDFSVPYLANNQVIVIPSGSPDIADLSGLDGLNVGVQIETTSHESARKAQESADFEIKAYDQIVQTFMDLKAGRLDAIVVDSMVAGEYLKSDQGTYEISSSKLTNEPIGICLKKGDNEELLNDINAAIVKLQENGKMAEISNKWFGADFASEIDSNLW